MQILAKENEAFQLAIRDPAMRAYLQRYPFAMGPDESMNDLCRQAIRNGLTPRNFRRTETIVHRLMPQETRLTAEQMDRLQQIMDESEIPQADREEMIDDYAWEANLVPPDSKNVLVIGCGVGYELMFLRAVLPEAQLTALDYGRSLTNALERATAVRFFEGDMNDLLAGFGQEFDLVSSNHTLEHLYEPTEILTILAGLLHDHGALISTLPMDGMDVSPFWQKVKTAATSKTIHPMDLVFMDAGHPWKTNPADLNATMQEAGFEHPLLYQRQEHLSRYANFGEKRFKNEMALGKVLHGIFFNLPRSMVKLLFPKNPPKIINKCLLAAERRIWFGTNVLKNRYTQEVLVLARKSPATV